MNVQTLKGFRDFLPQQMAVREYVISIFKEVFTSFGFEPLQTPTLEYADILMGKYGEEADKLLYTFEDRGGRKVGLNYDLTVPTARVLTQYQDLPKPFKRYQIQSSYRAENTQKGRYRQFTQCDIDTIGTTSPLADAEIITVICMAIRKLGFTDVQIFLNSRTILFTIMERAGISEDKWLTTLQTIDKMDKLSPEALDDELSAKGLGDSVFTRIIQPKLEEVTRNWAEIDPNLKRVFDAALKMGVSEENLKIKTSIVRGLDYYTSTIYEAVIPDGKVGSVAGGGRYDNLIKSLGGPDLPAVGTTIGLDRLCDVIEDRNLFPDLQKSSAKVLIVTESPNLTDKCLEIGSLLRSNNIKTEMYLDLTTKLEKQLKYADKKNIPYVMIIENENMVLKDMVTGEKKDVTIGNLPELLQ
jgi:histidyl-tRNA synthetase